MKFEVEALQLLADQQQMPLAGVVEVVEQALTDAYVKTPGADPKARARLDTAAGDLTVVSASSGQDVTPHDFGRLAAIATRQALQQWLRNVERLRKVGAWADTEGTVIQAVALPRRGTRPEMPLDLRRGRGVGCVLPDGEAIPAEQLTAGQSVSVLVLAVNATDRGTVRVTVSRRQPTLLTALFTDACPALRDGTIAIAAVARDPGVRSKIAVRSEVDGADPVAALVGPGGRFAREVVAAIGREKIDIVVQSDDLAAFAAAALTPAHVVSSAVTDVTRREVTVAVRPDQLALAIGYHGANVSLAQRLTGARIKVVPQPA